MTKLTRPLLLFAWVFFRLLPVVQAQNAQTVKGIIKDEKDNPVYGASVTEKGEPGNGVSSEKDGTFSLTLKGASGKLIISFIGYAKQEIKVSGGIITIKLVPEDKSVSDVVVIGYQGIQRRKTTAAVSTVKGKDIQNIPYTSFDQMLQGRVAGVSSLAISGEPGAKGNVVIRGTNSVSLGAVTAPLYVIDGVIFDVNDKPTAYATSNPLSALNPNDIESIDILKDASAAAIYGARAANGVILVKTKRAKVGKPEYFVSAYMGIADRPALKPVIVGADERRLKMDLLYAGGSYEDIANGRLSLMLTDSLNPAFNNNTDWQGLFLRSAKVNNQDAGVAGSDGKFAYRLSLNHYKEEGVMKGYHYERMQPHLYLSVNPGKKVNVMADVFLAFISQSHGSGSGSRYPFETWAFPSSFWKLTPDIISAYSGGYSSQLDDDRITSLNANIKLTDTILNNLFFTSSLSSNFDYNRRDWFYSKLVNPNQRNDAVSFNYNTNRWEIENYLTWFKNFKDHTITAVVGQGAEQQKNNNTLAEADGINISGVQTIQGLPPGSQVFAASFREERTRLSLFARVNYDYKGKYLLSASLRRDASSRYSPDYRWATFPSVSAGWIPSDEKFFEPLKKVISFFKIRASYGVTGRDPSNYYAQYQGLLTDGSYAGSSLTGGWFNGFDILGGYVAGGGMSTYNGTTVVYPDYNSAASTSTRWERYPQLNIGTDINLLHDRITITADWYVRDSKDLYFDNVQAQSTTGYAYYTGNLVDLRNTGVEFTINTTNLSAKSKFQWSTSFNIAFNENYITKLPNGNRDFIAGSPWMQQVLTVGRPVFTYNVWQTNGAFSTDADVPVDPLTGKKLSWYGGTSFAAGDPARVDQNGDYIINDLDKITYGDPNPHVTGGFINTFSYKGFSLQVLCSFMAGRKIWNGYLSDKFNGSSWNAYYDWGRQSGPASNLDGLTFWQHEGDVATYPGMVGNGVDKWHIANSTFIEDGSFFKLKQIIFGYSIPSKITGRLKARNLRLYGMMDNILTLSKATIPDPEAVGTNGWSNGSDYPVPHKYTLGIEVQF